MTTGALHAGALAFQGAGLIAAAFGVLIAMLGQRVKVAPYLRLFLLVWALTVLTVLGFSLARWLAWGVPGVWQ